MKIEYDGYRLDGDKVMVTADSPAYTHNFGVAKIKLRYRIQRAILRPWAMHRLGYGWIFTRKQMNKVLIEMLSQKEQK